MAYLGRVINRSEELETGGKRGRDERKERREKDARLVIEGQRWRRGGRGAKGIEEGERNPRRDLGKYYCNYTLRFISCVPAPKGLIALYTAVP